MPPSTRMYKSRSSTALDSGLIILWPGQDLTLVGLAETTRYLISHCSKVYLSEVRLIKCNLFLYSPNYLSHSSHITETHKSSAGLRAAVKFCQANLAALSILTPCIILLPPHHRDLSSSTITMASTQSLLNLDPSHISCIGGRTVLTCRNCAGNAPRYVERATSNCSRALIFIS